MEYEQIRGLIDARRDARSGSAREIRIRARRSTTWVAREVGVNQSTISRWETGQRQPTGEAAEKWADLLKVWREQEATSAA